MGPAATSNPISPNNKRVASPSPSTLRSRSESVSSSRAASDEHEITEISSPHDPKVKDERKDAPLSPSNNKRASLRVENLTRNIKNDHIKEIFGKFGRVEHIQLVPARNNRAPMAFVEFKTHADAENAQEHMDEGLVDGRKVRVRFGSEADEKAREKKREDGQSRTQVTNKQGRDRNNVVENRNLRKRSLSPRNNRRRSRSRSPIRRGPSGGRGGRRSPPFSTNRYGPSRSFRNGGGRGMGLRSPQRRRSPVNRRGGRSYSRSHSRSRSRTRSRSRSPFRGSRHPLSPPSRGRRGSMNRRRSRSRSSSSSCSSSSFSSSSRSRSRSSSRSHSPRRHRRSISRSRSRSVSCSHDRKRSVSRSSSRSRSPSFKRSKK